MKCVRRYCSRYSRGTKYLIKKRPKGQRIPPDFLRNLIRVDYRSNPGRAVVRRVYAARRFIDRNGIRVLSRVTHANYCVARSVDHRDAVAVNIRDINAIGFCIDGDSLRMLPNGQRSDDLFDCRSITLNVSSP